MRQSNNIRQERFHGCDYSGGRNHKHNKSLNNNYNCYNNSYNDENTFNYRKWENNEENEKKSKVKMGMIRF